MTTEPRKACSQAKARSTTQRVRPIRKPWGDAAAGDAPSRSIERAEVRIDDGP